MHKKDLAPVALFVYNRPWHTEQTLEALKRNALAAETVLYIFADGKKEKSSQEDSSKIKATREMIRNVSGFKKVIVVEKEKNQGLAQSIVSGVTEVVNTHGKIIVLEDDLVVSPFFLEFMNQGLDAYQDSANVYSVNGFMFPVKSKLRQTVLLPYTSTWGWATWKDKWSAFDAEMKGKAVLLANKEMSDRFNLGNYKYTDMLSYENNSWGIKWYYSVFMKQGLNVFPTRSLVSNIGFDGTGVNCENGEQIIKKVETKRIEVRKEYMIDPDFYNTYVRYFRPTKRKIILIKKIRNYLKIR